jgi:hypothetical protein
VDVKDVVSQDPEVVSGALVFTRTRVPAHGAGRSGALPHLRSPSEPHPPNRHRSRRSLSAGVKLPSFSGMFLPSGRWVVGHAPPYVESSSGVGEKGGG